MKKTAILTMLILSMFALTACGAELGTSEAIESTKVSEDMQAFMDTMNGKASGMQKALETYAIADLENDDMGQYNLENAIVTSISGDCYTMEAEYSTYIREYKVCWTDDKISSIEFKEELDKDRV